MKDQDTREVQRFPQTDGGGQERGCACLGLCRQPRQDWVNQAAVLDGSWHRQGPPLQVKLLSQIVIPFTNVSLSTSAR